MLSLDSLRSDTSAMGGKSYAAEEGKDASWAVGEKLSLK